MGRKMIIQCIECGHKQIGYSDRDGETCEKCKGYTMPKGWHTGVTEEQAYGNDCPGGKCDV